MDFSQYLVQLKYLLPEMALLIAAAVALFVHLFMKKNGKRIAGVVSLLGILLTLMIMLFAPLTSGTLFSGTMTSDAFGFFFKIIFLLAGAFSIMLSFKFFNVEGEEPGEVYYLLLFAVIGMMVAVSSVEMISFYVSFELFALTSYILAGIFKKERRSAEAGLKYFILGVLSSGIMLLGMALVYGLSGQTQFGEIAKRIGQIDSPLMMAGMILFFTGLFFKAALVPFHMWTPDVYEGAPTPLVVFLSTAPKAAVFAVLIRLIVTVFGAFQLKWTLLFGVVAVLSMFWGNVAALIQNNIKRMMAYSSIAHAGYLMIGLAAWGHTASMAVLFYLFIYLFMNTAAFGLILLVQKKSGFGEEVDDLNGLAQRSPLLAAGIVVLLLSLTGIPPTAGFIGKYYLFSAAVENKLYYLAVIGALNSVISLFYYFRIGKAIFMEEASGDVIKDQSLYVKTVIYICAAAVLFFGIAPSFLTNLASAVSLR